jgi:hypothetical protein
MGISVSTYSQDKAAGLVSISNINGIAFYVRKAFDPQTGAPKPELTQVNVEQIDAAIEQNAQDAANLAVLRADITAVLA